MSNILQALIQLFKQVKMLRRPLDPATLLSELEQFGVSLEDFEKMVTKMQASALRVQQQALSPPSSPSKIDTSSALERFFFHEYVVQPHKGHRVYTVEETRKISQRSIGFLIKLEQVCIINEEMREVIIDRLMRVYGDEQVRLPRTKWIVLQLLRDEEARSEDIACLEWLLHSDTTQFH